MYYNTPTQGYVYVFSNPSHQGYYKIGCTTDIPERLKKLSSESGVLKPFKKEFNVSVLDMYKAERLVHEELKQFRYSNDKEFFKADLETIKRAFGCLFNDYSTHLNNLRDSAVLSGKEYYKDKYIEFLDSSYKTLKKNDYNFEYYINIFKKNNKYYWAICYTEICNQEQYDKWVNSKKVLDSDNQSKIIVINKATKDKE